MQRPTNNNNQFNSSLCKTTQVSRYQENSHTLTTYFYEYYYMHLINSFQFIWSSFSVDLFPQLLSRFFFGLAQHLTPSTSQICILSTSHSHRVNLLYKNLYVTLTPCIHLITLISAHCNAISIFHHQPRYKYNNIQTIH